MPINSFSPPRIVIDTNSPVHAESSPHVRRTLDINRESDIHAVAGTPQTPISIHALRKESDPGTLRLTKRSKNFNPHSPCGERLRFSTKTIGRRNQVSSIDARPGWYHGEGAPHAVEERHRIFVDAYGRSPQGAWIEIYWSLSARSRNARVSGRIQDRTHGLLTRRCHQRSHRPASTPDEPNTGPYHAERSNPLRRSFPTRPSIPPPPTSTVRDAAAIH